MVPVATCTTTMHINKPIPNLDIDIDLHSPQALFAAKAIMSIEYVRA